MDKDEFEALIANLDEIKKGIIDTTINKKSKI